MDRDSYSYDPATWFNSFYRTMGVSNWISDRQTVGELDPRFIRHHYNSVENLILGSVGTTDFSGAAALDFGAGAGHWSDFALNTLGVGSVKQVEVSKVARDHLESKYAVDKRVKVLDNLYKTFGSRFDLIFSIGVLFHIVDDRRFETTLHRLIERLEPNGRLFISEAFEFETSDVQFHVTDKFSTWGECYGSTPQPMFVHKRLRSLRTWVRVVEEAGGMIEGGVRVNTAPPGFITPENNLIVVRKDK